MTLTQRFLSPALRRGLRLGGAAAVLAALTACAHHEATPYDYTAFKAAKPASVLILPPVNDTPDVGASYAVLSTLTLPLAESGYYVLPVSLVDETLRTNGIDNAVDAQSIDRAKLRDIFGADAGLYVTVKRYGSTYKVVSAEAVVEIEARLVDLRTGTQLWDGRASASTAEENNNNNSGVLALLVKALVEQIANSLNDRSYQVAGIASERLLSDRATNGVLPGPRKPVTERK
ncbi:DUF799 domain-containing protein [Roseateles sp. SL47]|jgi:hypothetical protein|uniref:DUF799 domain-containing protein n=1 Tax=Roseateles sp. SL47 TaxID=2995138 RepID=UPI0022722862|nr:DUF799 domain-containing protein [Roseateles sp. SL47]WAC73769.1 DUF799 domain-containing protein [Roseateles sp. SL47]